MQIRKAFFFYFQLPQFKNFAESSDDSKTTTDDETSHDENDDNDLSNDEAALTQLQQVQNLPRFSMHGFNVDPRIRALPLPRIGRFLQVSESKAEAEEGKIRPAKAVPRPRIGREDLLTGVSTATDEERNQHDIENGNL